MATHFHPLPYANLSRRTAWHANDATNDDGRVRQIDDRLIAPSDNAPLDAPQAIEQAQSNAWQQAAATPLPRTATTSLSRMNL